MSPWTLRALIVLLAPLLLAQGRRTRAVTPRLPEPAGPREGRTGQGLPLRLLIAGDSAAAGVGVDSQDQALSGQVARALTPHFELHWRLIAQTGWTTADLTERLRAEPAEPFDVALLSLGVNDVTGTVRTAAWLRQQRELADLLHQRFRVSQVLLTCVPPMQAFTALPQPLRALLGARAAQFNAALRDALSNWPAPPQCDLVQVPPPAHPGARPGANPASHPAALASDGFHPGAATYEAWADQVARRLVASSPAAPAGRREPSTAR